MSSVQLICGDCLDVLSRISSGSVHLVFLDPPFNLGKRYRSHHDRMDESDYWCWMADVVAESVRVLVDGGALIFMHRERNIPRIVNIAERLGLTLRNIIIWHKMTNPAHIRGLLAKDYQPLVYCIKGDRPRCFNPLKIDPPLKPNYRKPRPDGVYITDVWDDIRELTAGYFAGREAIRDSHGRRILNYQLPVALQLRIQLMTTLPGDTVLDPFCGLGTTAVVAHQIGRQCIAIDNDPVNIEVAQKRLDHPRPEDSVLKYRDYYRHTPNLNAIWKTTPETDTGDDPDQPKLF